MNEAHDQSRVAEQLERRRRGAAEAWSLESGQAVVIGAGTPLPVPGRGDRTYRFHAHSEYLYLTDRERPEAVLAFDPAEGWFDFVPQPTATELLWSGAPAAELGLAIEELAGWLAARNGARIANLGAAVPGAANDPDLEAELRYALNCIRRVKDELEIERMRKAERATKAGFAVAAELIAPGRSERELQIEIEATFLRNGGDALAFDTIVAGGPNTAVLHFMPTRVRSQTANSSSSTRARKYAGTRVTSPGRIPPRARSHRSSKLCTVSSPPRAAPRSSIASPAPSGSTCTPPPPASSPRGSSISACYGAFLTPSSNPAR